jgi:hypothetical protein
VDKLWRERKTRKSYIDFKYKNKQSDFIYEKREMRADLLRHIKLYETFSFACVSEIVLLPKIELNANVRERKVFMT